MNNFFIDDEWQKKQRDEILAPNFYQKYTFDGRYVFIDKGRLATILQKRYAVDTVVQGKFGTAACIQEKIVRWPGYSYKCFSLETDSCTIPDFESEGWMHYCRADYLFYCFAQENGDLLCFLIDFYGLKQWFWPRVEQFKTFMMNAKNRTAGRLVPITDLRENVSTRVYVVRHPQNEIRAAE
jgi:hypothetical protein